MSSENSELNDIRKELSEMKKMLKEVHTITTGKLYQPSEKPKRLTKKQKLDAELLQRSREAHNRMLNKLNKKGAE